MVSDNEMEIALGRLRKNAVNKIKHVSITNITLYQVKLNFSLAARLVIYKNNTNTPPRYTNTKI